MKRSQKTTPYIKVKTIGQRLVVRPYLFTDFQTCRASHQSRRPQATKYDEPIRVAAESDYQKFKRRVERYRNNGRKRKQFVFGIFEKTSQEYVGQVDFLMINEQIRWGNLGYHIQNQYFGRGYGTEAAGLALKIAFNALGFYRIEAAMELDNKPSEKLARAIGLEFEGVRKKFFPDNGGIDLKVYAMNALDFKSKK